MTEAEMEVRLRAFGLHGECWATHASPSGYWGWARAWQDARDDVHIETTKYLLGQTPEEAEVAARKCLVEFVERLRGEGDD